MKSSKSDVVSVSHTPGPWTLEKRYRGSKYWHIGNLVETPIFSLLCERKEAHANARLIAAAPDLLSACKGELEALEIWIRAANIPDDVFDGMQISRDKLRSAIDHATTQKEGAK